VLLVPRQRRRTCVAAVRVRVLEEGVVKPYCPRCGRIMDLRGHPKSVLALRRNPHFYPATRLCRECNPPRPEGYPRVCARCQRMMEADGEPTRRPRPDEQITLVLDPVGGSLITLCTECMPVDFELKADERCKACRGSGQTPPAVLFPDDGSDEEEYDWFLKQGTRPACPECKGTGRISGTRA
jgi:hypothetical protein